MKKFLLTICSSLLLGTSALMAQNPDVIYIGSWDGMTSAFGSHGVGTPVTPDTSDPKLSYNADTNCYEGVIYDWSVSSGTATWNAKIPYSFEGDVVTYYSGTTYSNIDFRNNGETQSFKFIVSEDPATLKGYNLNAINEKFYGSVLAAKVSLNLETNTITFTLTENDSQAPTLVSINPESGTMVTPAADGSVTISLTFSGEVTSMRVLVEGGSPKTTKNDDGTVWTIQISENQVTESVNENTGTLLIKIDQVFAGNLPVTFDGGSLQTYISYPVNGVTKSASLQFAGASADAQVALYKSPFYTVGDELEIKNNAYDALYFNSATYLITAAEGYRVSISSSAPEDSWSIGSAWSIKSTIDPDTETATEENYRQGTTLTLTNGADGAVFTVNVAKEDAGVDSIGSDLDASPVIYNLQGVRVNNPQKGAIYIINGKKTILR